jgi:hypothetical protein
MIFSFPDIIQLVMVLISLSVFVLKPTPGYLKFYPIYFTCGLILNFYVEYTTSKGIHNTGVVNFYNIADYSFICLILRGFITDKKIRKVILLSLVIFALFAIINLVFIQKKDGFNPVNYTVESLITASLCIYYFFELFQKTEAPSLSGLPSFWITSAILFNVVLSFPMFASLSFMDEQTVQNQVSFKLIFDNIDSIFNIILVLTYILYSIGFLCVIRISKSTL